MIFKNKYLPFDTLKTVWYRRCDIIIHNIGSDKNIPTLKKKSFKCHLYYKDDWYKNLHHLAPIKISFYITQKKKKLLTLIEIPNWEERCEGNVEELSNCPYHY